MSFGLSDIFGGGNKVNLPNAPDLSFLKDYSGLDFLKNPAGAGTPNNTDELFQQLLGSINQFKGPSSIDDVMSSLNNDQLNQTLAGIDRDTAQASSGVRQDALDRGLGGPGLGSDIEQAGLGQVAATGAQTKASARTDLYKTNLAAQKAQEDQYRQALEGAYGQQYQTGSNLYSQLLGLNNSNQQDLAGLINSRDIARATGANSAYQTQVQGALNNYNPNVFQDILRNVKVGVNFGGN